MHDNRTSKRDRRLPLWRARSPKYRFFFKQRTCTETLWMLRKVSRHAMAVTDACQTRSRYPTWSLDNTKNCTCRDKVSSIQIDCLVARSNRAGWKKTKKIAPIPPILRNDILKLCRLCSPSTEKPPQIQKQKNNRKYDP